MDKTAAVVKADEKNELGGLQDNKIFELSTVDFVDWSRCISHLDWQARPTANWSNASMRGYMVASASARCRRGPGL